MTSQTLDYPQRWPGMAAIEHDKSQDTMESRFTSVNSYLWTPPENNADSFSQDVNMTKEQPQEWQQRSKLPPLQQPHTPPTSPGARSLPSIGDATGYASNDEPLYPERQTDRARSQTPLFGADRSPSIPDAPALHRGEDVGQDMLSKLIIGPNTHVSPRTDSSALRSTEQSDSFPGILGIATGRQALMYYYRRMNELKAVNRARRTARLPPLKKTQSPELDDFTQRQLQKLGPKRAAVTKSYAQPKSISKRRTVSASVSASPVQQTSRPNKRHSKVRSYSEGLDAGFSHSQEKKQHKRAPPSKKVEDSKPWYEIEDFAPSTDTLDTSGKVLKASWQGVNPLDLSDDPDRHHLHPQELVVASTLRLTCAQYLANKRKIFLAKRQHVREGKNFTKTAAQGTCSIDVNKASQLHMAFTRVGWLEDSLFV